MFVYTYFGLYVCLFWYMSIYLHVCIFYVHVYRYEWINLCVSVQCMSVISFFLVCLCVLVCICVCVCA